MQASTAKAIFAAAKEQRSQISIMHEYSRRGMPTTTTSAVVVTSMGDLYVAIAAAARRFHKSQLEEFYFDLHNLRQDQLGKNIIIY